MKKTPAFWVSVSLNVVLIIGLLLTATGAIQLHKPAKAAAIAPSTDDGRKIEQALHAAGLGASEAKRVIEALVLQADAQATPHEYWVSSQVRDLRAQIEALERSARARTTLVGMFGPAAQDDPAFASVFSPYDREFPMLSQVQQVQLQEYKLRRLKAQLESAATGGMPVRAMTQDDPLEQVLNPEQQFEYLLRESVLSRALSASSFQFTEAEFRQAFAILAKADPEMVMGVNPVELSEAVARDANRKALVEALGQDRYDALRRARDPAYNLLRRIAQVRGISEDKIEQAYLMLTGSLAPVGDPAKAKLPQELEELLGAQRANEVFRAFLHTRQQAPGRALPQATAHLSGKPIQASPFDNR